MLFVPKGSPFPVVWVEDTCKGVTTNMGKLISMYNEVYYSQRLTKLKQEGNGFEVFEGVHELVASGARLVEGVSGQLLY